MRTRSGVMAKKIDITNIGVRKGCVTHTYAC